MFVVYRLKDFKTFTKLLYIFFKICYLIKFKIDKMYTYKTYLLI